MQYIFSRVTSLDLGREADMVEDTLTHIFLVYVNNNTEHSYLHMDLIDVFNINKVGLLS